MSGGGALGSAAVSLRKEEVRKTEKVLAEGEVGLGVVEVLEETEGFLSLRQGGARLKKAL